MPPGTPGEIQPPAQPADLRAHAEPSQTAPARLQWAQVFPGALLAGLLMAAALVLPLAGPVLLMAAAGLFSAAIYQRRTQTLLTPGMGARAGMVGGVLGFALIAALLALQIATGDGHLLTMLRQAVADQIARTPDPRAQQMMQQFLTPGGLAVLAAIGMLFFLAFALVCSAAGGALGAYVFGRRKQR